MKFTSLRAIKMPSIVIIPTIVITIDRGYFADDYRSLVIALRWLKFAIISRWG